MSETRQLPKNVAIHQSDDLAFRHPLTSCVTQITKTTALSSRISRHPLVLLRATYVEVSVHLPVALEHLALSASREALWVATLNRVQFGVF